MTGEDCRKKWDRNGVLDYCQSFIRTRSVLLLWIILCLIKDTVRRHPGQGMDAKQKE